MKRLWLILALLALLCDGCGGYKDIDRRAFPVVMAVDKGEKGNIRLSLRMAVPQTGSSSSGEAGGNSFVLTQEAPSIAEATRLIKAQSDREIDYAHTKIILFGKSLVQEDLSRHIDWFIRRRDAQNIAFVAMADGDAQEILRIRPTIEKVPGNSLFLTFGDSGVETQYIESRYLFQLFRAFLNEGETPFLPIIRAQGNHYEVNGVGLLDKKHLVATLGPRDSAIFRMLTEHVEKGLLPLESGYALSAIKEDTQYELEPGEIKIRCKLDFAVEQSSKLQPVTEAMTRDLENQVKGKMRKDVARLVQLFLEKNLDPMHLTQQFEATHWKAADRAEWKRLYKKATVTVEPEVRIENAGLMR